ncbi:restriction endonuclease [Rhodococcus erythropolis]|uniref:nSTAND1 domain-containing NTPase n=1 Tax=Rhodococcus erythropolis TaxID=1833 RepID=UPI001EDF64FF|nr:restriction endonuclease [Rhodococcus erythropolis]UKO89777.1 restriction endonuclease [Rhodococcus erythropolis]
MSGTIVKDPILLLLVDEESTAATSNAKGHLFENFMANVMHHLGYQKPSTNSLNVTSEGVELDISLNHSMNRSRAIAECKAYSSNINVGLLTAFYGRLAALRLREPAVEGYFFALPRMTSAAAEQARSIQESDPGFRSFTASEIWDLLNERDLISPVGAELVSDHALVVHESGFHTAALKIDPHTRTATHVIVKSINNGVSPLVVDLLGQHAYAQGLPVLTTDLAGGPPREDMAPSPPLVIEVNGSHSDFEYQLPASPRYFVGRRDALRDLIALVDARGGPFVLNAQSGWGKSSLALKLASQTQGVATVIDTRTASSGSFVPAAIRKAAETAQQAGLVTLAEDASWATTAGALRSIQNSDWLPSSHLLIIFDQFENIFTDPLLTQEFRDVALWNSDVREHITFGFAWKTDYVDWIENHPYRLRDQIRNASTIFHLSPFGSREVGTLLKRLETTVQISLSKELRQRLREYSQGLPWLLKKLSGHVIREFKGGKTQEQLIGEALNIQDLFDSDLRALDPQERDALGYVARYAPVRATEVTEKYSAGLVQSLLNQRLIVQVGEKLDTYWDTFRDYLNTGRVPIEDSYILRLSPNSVARLVSELLAHDGSLATSDIAEAWDTSENVVWNYTRELRQLGLAPPEIGQVSLISEVAAATDPEAEIKTRVATALRRHRAYSEFTELAERGHGKVTAAALADRLRRAFPAVEGTDHTWTTYARTFLAWLEYVGLARNANNGYELAPEGSVGVGSLTSKPSSFAKKTGVFPTVSPGPAIELLRQSVSGRISAPPNRKKHLAQLISLKAVSLSKDGNYIVVDGLVSDGEVVPETLLKLLQEKPGGARAIELLQSNTSVGIKDVAEIFESAYNAAWTHSTKEVVGKAFFAWSRAAGLTTKRGARRPKQRKQ